MSVIEILITVEQIFCEKIMKWFFNDIPYEKTEIMHFAFG